MTIDDPVGGQYVVTGANGVSPPPTVENTVVPLLSWIWAAGVLCLWAWAVFSYLRLKRRLCAAVKTEDGGWESDRAASLFVLGFFPAKIYLPLGLQRRPAASSSSTRRPMSTGATTLSRPWPSLS